jgi:uncharacterized protein YjbI with pentapeptide repeats
VGTAIHLDGVQRVVFANNTGQLCAEPSPDALQSYAAAVGLGASKPGLGDANIAAALQTGSGSIGLRTQSITLMRDALFRICESAYNGFIKPLDVSQLLERSQDETLGILAIEQLTGAVGARQLALSGASTAGAPGAGAQGAGAQGTGAQGAAAHGAAAQSATAQGADAQGAAAQSAAGQGVAAQGADAQGADAQGADAQGADAQSGDAQGADAQAGDAQAAGAQGAADQGAGAPKASVNANLSTGTDRNNISAETVAKIADTTSAIVGLIVMKGHVVDGCMNIYNRYLDMSAEDETNRQPMLKPIFDQCRKAVDAYLSSYLKNYEPPAALPPPAPPPPPPPQPLQ